MTTVLAIRPSTGEPRPPHRTPTRRADWVGFAVVLAAMILNILDSTIVNVAAPAIQRDLGMSDLGAGVDRRGLHARARRRPDDRRPARRHVRPASGCCSIGLAGFVLASVALLAGLVARTP